MGTEVGCRPYPDLPGRTPVATECPFGGCTFHTPRRYPQCPSLAAERANLESTQAELLRIFKLLDDDHFELLDLPVDAVGDETDSDDGDSGDFVVVKPFQQVVGDRTTNSSRSASVSSGSWTLPTTTSNAFQALSSELQCRLHRCHRTFDDILRGGVTTQTRLSMSRREFVERSPRREPGSASERSPLLR